jgi:hypothetical protein
MARKSLMNRPPEEAPAPEADPLDVAIEAALADEPAAEEAPRFQTIVEDAPVEEPAAPAAPMAVEPVEAPLPASTLLEMQAGREALTRIASQG